LADIFHDIEDAIRQDKLKKLWLRLRWPLAGLVVIIVGLVIAYVLITDATETRKLDQALKFYNALEVSEAGDKDTAAKMFLELAKNSDDPAYLIFSQFRAAQAFTSEGKISEAVNTYDSISSNTKVFPIYRDLATYLGADLLVDTASFLDIKEKIAPILLGDSVWKPMAQETLALSAVKSGNIAEAREILGSLSIEISVPSGVKERSIKLLAVLDSESSISKGH
jgi:hypothetical protein